MTLFSYNSIDIKTIFNSGIWFGKSIREIENAVIQLYFYHPIIDMELISRIDIEEGSRGREEFIFISNNIIF